MRGAGVTLPEMLAVVAIFSLVMGFAVPSFKGLLHRSQATSSINWLVRSIHFARQNAILKNQNVTICPNRSSANRCEGKWQEGLIVFSDANQNATIDGRDLVLARFAPDQLKGSIIWRSFRNRQYLQFTPFGFTNSQNGNFTYCPDDDNLKYARQIVLNAQGRLRSIANKNDRGVRLDRKGKPLRC